MGIYFELLNESIMLEASQFSRFFTNPEPLKVIHNLLKVSHDTELSISPTNNIKQARAALEKEIKAKEAELLKQKEELDKLNKDWKDQAALLSEDARLKKQQDFQEKFLALRNAEMEFQANIKRKEQKATQQIAVKVAGVVDALARSKKLTGVFETNSAGLLYLDQPVDLTQDVINEYSKQKPAAPSAPDANAGKPTDKKP